MEVSVGLAAKIDSPPIYTCLSLQDFNHQRLYIESVKMVNWKPENLKKNGKLKAVDLIICEVRSMDLTYQATSYLEDHPIYSKWLVMGVTTHL